MDRPVYRENKLGLTSSCDFIIPSYLKTALILQLKIQYVPKQERGYLLP